jgi:hypothetical protein
LFLREGCDSPISKSEHYTTNRRRVKTLSVVVNFEHFKELIQTHIPLPSSAFGVCHPLKERDLLATTYLRSPSLREYLGYAEGREVTFRYVVAKF